MKTGIRPLLLAAMVASSALAGANAMASNASPSTKEQVNKCVSEAKAKGLSGDALKAAEKKCHEDAKSKK